MKQPEAAAIYYQSSIEEFPDTDIAEFCRGRLFNLKEKLLEEKIIDEVPCRESGEVNEECSADEA